MEEKAKKPSLFKQRMAALKPHTNGAGFPQPINIITPQLQNDSISNSQGVPTSSEEVKFEKTLIDMIKGQSLLKDDDSKKIQQDNWATIEAMSQKERQELIKQATSDLNENFINKIKKNPIKQTVPVPTPPQPQNSQGKSKQTEEKQQNNESWQQFLKINIETDKLCYSEQNEENLVGLARMIEMVGSENNQSQIIGSKLVAKLVDYLTVEATSKSRELVIINYVPLHLSIIFERCSFLLFEPMIKKARNTSFRSAFVEITTNIAQILTKVHKYLSNHHKQNLLKQMKALVDKCKSFKIDKQSMDSLRSSLDVICSVLEQHSNKVEDENWQSLKEHADIILELILIQQSEASYFNSYALNILYFIDKSSDLTQIVEVQCFVYQIINKFVLRKTKELYLDLQAFRTIWRPVIDILAGKLLSKLVNIELQAIFQVIFLARFTGGTTWERIVASMQQLSSIKYMVPHFILFNTLSDQKSAGLREQNLQSLNQVFNWLANVLSKSPSKLNPNFIISTLLELFLQEEQFYSQLDQAILQKLLTSIATNASTNFSIIFTQEKVRTLITNYSFNSFGNEVFTNLLLFVAIKGASDLEALILREVVARYTSNFIGAASRLNVDLPAIQGQKLSSNQQTKSDILQSLKKQSQKNIFFAYLSS